MKTDEQLKTDVTSEMEWDPAINATHVGVAVKGGLVRPPDPEPGRPPVIDCTQRRPPIGTTQCADEPHATQLPPCAFEHYRDRRPVRTTRANALFDWWVHLAASPAKQLELLQWSPLQAAPGRHVPAP